MYLSKLVLSLTQVTILLQHSVFQMFPNVRCCLKQSTVATHGSVEFQNFL